MASFGVKDETMTNSSYDDYQRIMPILLCIILAWAYICFKSDVSILIPTHNLIGLKKDTAIVCMAPLPPSFPTLALNFHIPPECIVVCIRC